MLWTSSDLDTFKTLQPPMLFPVTSDTTRRVEFNLEVGNTCTKDTTTLGVIINPTQIRALAQVPDDEICPGDPLVVYNISTPGTMVDYLFSDDRQFFGDTISPIFSEPGEYNFIIFARGCGFDQDTINFSVTNPPRLNLDIDPIVCADAASEYQLDAGVAQVMIYFPNGDSSDVNIGTYRFSLNPSTQTLTYRAVNNEGCVSQGSTSVEITAPPEAIISISTDTVCTGEEINLNNIGMGGQTCRWRVGDQLITDGCTVSTLLDESGSQVVELISTSELGCTDTSATVVFVRPLPDIELMAIYDTTACSPTQVQFEYIGDLTIVSSLRLSPGDGSGVLQSFDPVHTYDTSGIVTATLRAAYDGVCAFNQSVRLNLRQTPTALTQVLDERCNGAEAAIVTVSTENSADIINGFGPDGYRRSGLNQFDLTFPGDYVFQVTSPDGCDTMIAYELPEARPLLIKTIEDTLIFLGESLELTTFSNRSSTLFNWTPFPPEFDSLSRVQSPEISPILTTEYTVVGVDSFTGCENVDRVTVTVDRDSKVYIPTAFSPNNDGVNDALIVFPGPGVERINSLQIFDRWGSQVYIQNEPHPTLLPRFRWDVSESEDFPNAAVFSYVLFYTEFGGRARRIKGLVTVVR